MTEQKKLTGYPSIDKPWMKYYSNIDIDNAIPDKSMYELLLEQNNDRQDSIAINYYGNKITYRTLFENIKRTADALIANGIKPGDIVSILSLNTPETTYFIYALNYIGAVANLLIANTTAKEVLDNIKETNSKLFIVLDKMLERMGAFESPIPLVILSIDYSAKGINKFIFKLVGSKQKKNVSYREFVEGKRTDAKKIEFKRNMPAVIVYTSGTTGQPKGVVLSNENLNACAIMCALSGKNYRPNDTFLNILPPFYSFGIGMKHLCLYAAVTEIPVLIPTVKSVQKMLKKHRPNYLVIGPALTDSIETYNKKDLSFLIDLTGGGGSISLDTERRINKILSEKGSISKYLSGYGMTELSAAVSMNQNDKYKEQSIGLPLPLVNVKICDANTGEELGYGQEGELLINSPGLMIGYFNNTDETNKVIEISKDGTRWMHTGDLARVDRDGFVFITGRLKRIYIVTDEKNIAYKLFPQRIEELIQQMEEVHKCGVVVVEDSKKGYVPIVFVSLNKNAQIKGIKDNIYKVISENLPMYYEPKDICIIDEMPTNANQKINYRALENMIV